MKETFITKRFNTKSKAMLPLIEAIMVNYGQRGMDLTVRQLHYRLNALHPQLYPNDLKSYKMLVALLTNGRYAGVLDWSTLIDRARGARRSTSWSTPKSFFADVPYWWQYDKWTDQPYHIEVMAEKDAATGTCQPICSELDVAFTANKGYTSSSEIYRTAKRLRSKYDAGKKIVIIYIGDHDPSGIQMTDDITRRVQLLAGDSISRTGKLESVPLQDIDIRRIGLNFDQVKKYELQENFAKDSDSRTPAYVAQFGESCWELDALDPDVIVELIKNEVLGLRDQVKWDAAVEKENKMREAIKKHCEKFDKKPTRRRK